MKRALEMNNHETESKSGARNEKDLQNQQMKKEGLPGSPREN
jgi:hypothetical protein